MFSLFYLIYFIGLDYRHDDGGDGRDETRRMIPPFYRHSFLGIPN